MLSLPYTTPAGTVAFKFRCIKDHDCKAEKCQRYDAPSGQQTRLYNAGVLATTSSTKVAVVEGEIKAIVATHVLGIPAVGCSASTWLAHWPRCLGDFEEVLVIADNDVKDDSSNPGLKHAKTVQSTIQNSRIVLPPPNVDLDEWVLRDGAEAVRKGLGIE